MKETLIRVLRRMTSPYSSLVGDDRSVMLVRPRIGVLFIQVHPSKDGSSPLQVSTHFGHAEPFGAWSWPELSESSLDEALQILFPLDVYQGCEHLQFQDVDIVESYAPPPPWDYEAEGCHIWEQRAVAHDRSVWYRWCDRGRVGGNGKHITGMPTKERNAMLGAAWCHWCEIVYADAPDVSTAPSKAETE